MEMNVVLGTATISDYDILISMLTPWDVVEEVSEDEEDIVRLPSPASCLYISWPRLLFTGSLVAFVTALGIYLGFLMSLNLNDNNTSDGSRNVFIIYAIVAALSYMMYNQASSILAGRTRGAQDTGDRIMIDLAKRRHHTLKSRKLRNSAEYRTWRRHNAREKHDQKGQSTPGPRDEEETLETLKPTFAQSVMSDPAPQASTELAPTFMDRNIGAMLREAVNLGHKQARLLQQISMGIGGPNHSTAGFEIGHDG